MNFTRICRNSAVALFLVATASPALAADATASTGDAVRGKQLYHDHGCYGCHGFNGNTGARDLVATSSPLIADLATFTMYLRLRGDQAPLLPSTRMPNYPVSALPDADVRDIYAHVRTFKPDATVVSDIPALKAILESASRETASRESSSRQGARPASRGEAGSMRSNAPSSSSVSR